MTKKRNNEDTIEDPVQEGLRPGAVADAPPPLPLADFSDSGEPVPQRHDQSFDEVPEHEAPVVTVIAPLRRAAASEDDTDDFPDVEVVEEAGVAVLHATPFVGAAPVAVPPAPAPTNDDAPTVYGVTPDIPVPPPAPRDFPEDDPPEIIAPDSHPIHTEDEAEPEPNHEPAWWATTEAMVELVGEMEEEAEEFDHLQSDQAKTCRLVVSRLINILRRGGVTVIGAADSGATEDVVGQPFDRSRHQPVGLDGSDEESVVQEVTRPGFVVGSRVLRRARVRLKAMA